MEFIKLDKQNISDFKEFISDPSVKCIDKFMSDTIVDLTYNTNERFRIPRDLYNELYPSKYSNDLIFGKDKTENIVSVEIDNKNIIIYKETATSVIKEIRPNTYWLITHDKVSSKQTELLGNQHYKWLGKFDNLSDYIKAKNNVYQYDHYKITDAKEATLVYNGITYFKGMSVSDVSVLSFDIESDGLAHKSNSEIYLITNTYRKNARLVRKTFRLDEFTSQGEMLVAWADWVREMDPSILLGHNVLSYDIPYIMHVAQLNEVEICLGRDNSSPHIAKYTSKFRKDGSQSYDYNNIYIHGREIVDTMFLSIKYDVARNFESYGLKAVVKHLGLEKEGRTLVDASRIKEYYNSRKDNPENWNNTVKYAEEDSDDSLKIFDVMAPSYFYFTQSVSKSFQQMINQATGSQINNMMVRSYLQEGKSIAKADESGAFEGGISMGVPGIYRNCLKWDLQSAYPHTIIQFELYDKKKDPEAKFLNMVLYFTKERIKNKKLAKETGEIYYKDMEQSQKVVINSFFGFCGAPGLNYNAPAIAAMITEKCRGYIRDAIIWATGKDLEYWKRLNSEEETEVEDENV